MLNDLLLAQEKSFFVVMKEHGKRLKKSGEKVNSNAASIVWGVVPKSKAEKNSEENEHEAAETHESSRERYKETKQESDHQQRNRN